MRETALEQMQALLRESNKLAKRSADVMRRMQALAIQIDAEAIRRASESMRTRRR